MYKLYKASYAKVNESHDDESTNEISPKITCKKKESIMCKESHEINRKTHPLHVKNVKNHMPRVLNPQA